MFWEQRKQELQAVIIAKDQSPGIPNSTLKSITSYDPEKGMVNVNLNAQIIAQIFKEYPGVERAYLENVPKNFSAEEFFTRFFRSSYFYGRTQSNLLASTSREAKIESMFSKYRAEEERDAKGKALKKTRLDKDIDITTDEGVEGSGYGLAKEATSAKMGGESISLIRMINRHSDVVLETTIPTAASDATPAATQAATAPTTSSSSMSSSSSNKITEEKSFMKHLILEDLLEEQPISFVPLNITDQHRLGSVSSSSSSSSTSSQPTSSESNSSVVSSLSTSHQWERVVSQKSSA